MPIYIPAESDTIIKKVNGQLRKLLKTEACDKFNTELLGLGDLRKPATSTDAIAAVFDLQGFTTFCKQIEPHLSVPLFLSEFLSWLIAEIKSEIVKEKLPDGSELWSPLPFFIKFMGDGILVLWDSTDMNDVARRNIVLSLHQICNHYAWQFRRTLVGKVTDPPEFLRCGAARGTVYSVGDGNDFVGTCINMAARVQKLPGCSFAFNRRGFDLETPKAVKFFKEDLVIRAVSIRGIGDNELVAIRKSEFKKMSAADRKLFRRP